ncbi:hypothetical protein, variant 2 [Blastomyces dermatitidis ER-3]|uniref:Uncharacterized protein n=1 Tax=Ajellomyces dermatitidis (strain ER-3 / ATCC MYA-2586) TaxID=559297 RepID=A0ABX2VQA6_AJEDR|nr:hypothetical protein, variant 1 [Blastomyces dermatitidis ER-3]XP_045279167.1 hypothetical protein, variant 2 [Blastomyces dermatitidis ER-3]OAS99438.1 hypothetical protein, variant 1 [Blastomyces dermatitidis ER-3]OAS99439.1 hypothetical protein, variant 2 [Blastomyces dermatitidis ER-3]
MYVFQWGHCHGNGSKLRLGWNHTELFFGPELATNVQLYLDLDTYSPRYLLLKGTTES